MPHAEQNVELRTIVLLFLTMFVSGTETMIVNPVLPHFGRLPVIVAGNLSVLAVIFAVSSAPYRALDREVFFPRQHIRHRESVVRAVFHSPECLCGKIECH